MKLLILAVLTLLNFSTNADVINDSDLSSSSFKSIESQDYFRADLKEAFPLRRNTISIKTILVKDSVETEITGINYKLQMGSRNQIIAHVGEEIEWDACASESKYRGSAKLVLDQFKIQNSRGREYELLFSGNCGEALVLKFNYDSLGGQFFGVWNVAKSVTKKFSENDLGDFISSKIKIKFPSGGDYYNGTVNVTKGYQWDVVGHEIGHAIYSRARIGRSAGGSHRIDECYSSALALSEGWASFFSAWVSVDLDDADAKFEYMVPRRAPLEIEHVPSDVCVGPKNEWRVYSFLWDLVDLNNDNENINIGFKELWDVSAGVLHKDIKSFRDGLIRSGVDPVIVNIVWDQNILNR
jgi:hypothetical protein